MMTVQFSQGHALVIGVGYANEPALNNIQLITSADAQAVAKVLRDPQRCGYPTGQVKTLLDTEATKSNILAGLDALAKSSPDDTVVIFYSGHGGLTVSSEFYLTTSDTRLGGQPDDYGISQIELIEKLQAIPARRLLALFHACHSGAAAPIAFGTDEAEGMQPTNPPPDTSAALLGTGEGRIILNSSRANQLSYGGDNPEGRSIFTNALVSALSGEGIENRYGFISLFDLYDFVYRTVKQEAAHIHVVQEPELNISKGVGRFAVALYQGAPNASPTAFETMPFQEPEGPAIHTISPEESQAKLTQILNIAGDQIDARRSKGFINRPTGPVNQVFGDQQTIETSGGPYIGRVEMGSGDFMTGDKNVTEDNRGRGGIYAEGAIDMRGAIVNIDATLANVTQAIGALPNADQATKEALTQLVAQLQAELRQVPPEQSHTAEMLSQRVNDVVQDAGKESQDKELVEFNLGRLRKAAVEMVKAVPSVLPLALDIIDKIMTLVR